MADTKISALSAAAAAAAAMELAANDAGASKKVTIGQILTLQGGSLRNSNSGTPQAVTAATLTYIAGSSIAVPAGKLRLGTVFRWQLDITKSAAGTAARNWFLKIGTAGTTADATILTFGASVVPTAVVDTGWIDCKVTIMGPLTSSCICRGSMKMGHKLATTGLANQSQEQIFDATSAAFNATTANLIVGLALTTGAAEVITIQQVDVEAWNL